MSDKPEDVHSSSAERRVVALACLTESDEIQVHAPFCGPLGQFILEPPCRLLGGATSFRGLAVGAFSYSWSHLSDAVRSIGRYCSIAGQVSFGATEHPTAWLSTSSMTYEAHWMWGDFAGKRGGSALEVGPPPTTEDRDRVTIGHDVWIGLGAYIRGGVTLGHGCIVGAHAVVTRDVAPYTIVAGNPARVLRARFDDETIARLLRLEWWRFPFHEFRDVPVRDVPAAVDRIEALIADGLTPYEPASIQVTN